MYFCFAEISQQAFTCPGVLFQLLLYYKPSHFSVEKIKQIIKTYSWLCEYILYNLEISI